MPGENRARSNRCNFRLVEDIVPRYEEGLCAPNRGRYGNGIRVGIHALDIRVHHPNGQDRFGAEKFVE